MKAKLAQKKTAVKKAAKKIGTQAAQKVGAAKKPSFARRGLKFAAAAGAMTALAMGVNRMRKSMAAAHLDSQDSDTGADDTATSAQDDAASQKRSAARTADRGATATAQR